MNTHPPTSTFPVYASAAAGSLWTVAETLVHYGPSWGQIPPLMFAVASVVAAVNTAVNDRHRRRLAEIEARKPKAFTPILFSKN